MNKFQNYLNYKLPITSNPLEYGKLLDHSGNKYIIQLNTNNILILKRSEETNFIRLFKRGELMFEFKDQYISDIKFIRIISDQKYTFENNKLISTQILNVSGGVN